MAVIQITKESNLVSNIGNFHDVPSMCNFVLDSYLLIKFCSINLDYLFEVETTKGEGRSNGN